MNEIVKASRGTLVQNERTGMVPAEGRARITSEVVSAPRKESRWGDVIEGVGNCAAWFGFAMTLIAVLIVIALGVLLSIGLEQSVLLLVWVLASGAASVWALVRFMWRASFRNMLVCDLVFVALVVPVAWRLEAHVPSKKEAVERYRPARSIDFRLSTDEAFYADTGQPVVGKDVEWVKKERARMRRIPEFFDGCDEFLYCGQSGVKFEEPREDAK